MAVAGIPSEIWPNNGLSDARIFFCLTTLAVAAVALYLCRADGRRKIRALQALIILPLAVAAAGDRGRRHPGRGLPPPRHGAGATAKTVRVGRRLRHRVGHEVHRLAAGGAGALRRARPKRRAAPVLHAGRDDRRRRPDHLPLRPARPVRPHRRRRALPARPERHSDDGGERVARSRAGQRVPVAQPRPAALGRDRAGRAAGAPPLPAHAAHGGGGLHDRRRGDVCAHPAGPGPAGRLPALPDQLLRLGLSAGRAGPVVRPLADGRRRRGRSEAERRRARVHRPATASPYAASLFGIGDLEEPDGEVGHPAGRAARRNVVGATVAPISQ